MTFNSFIGLKTTTLKIYFKNYNIYIYVYTINTWIEARKFFEKLEKSNYIITIKNKIHIKKFFDFLSALFVCMYTKYVLCDFYKMT